jgi:transglutaminase-like putative cysteine protease
MRYTLLSLAVFSMALSLGCSSRHLITNKEYMNIVEKTFEERQHMSSGRYDTLFGVFKKKLTNEQSEALKYLYAFMPLNDLADYDGYFFLANVNQSLRAREETPWGKSIPEDIFLHYVLPVRVNNENLDSFRIDYYDEIMNRVKGLNLHDAALEINHWCHEKVAYQAADERTSAPMSTILSARGRCGEESTFTVAALRTAGIPARQVYTPRWAHCDDNHAWVEIWNNGTWYYTGACEPEPVFDLGWFTEPSRRAMLVHTKSFGAPYGNENTIVKKKYYSDVNNLSKYAVTKTVYVKVLDEKGSPVEDANVEYQLYNYAEFYPLAIVPTDADGLSHFETGLGDLLIWAQKKNSFNYKKISVNEIDTLTLTLGRNPADEYKINLDLSVPVVPPPLPGPPPEAVAENARRIEKENSIRQQYINTWMKPGDAVKLASRLSLDSGMVKQVIEKSMGNYMEISSFLVNSPDSLRDLSLEMLGVISDKDLRDTKYSTLEDHLINSIHKADLKGENSQILFINYVLNPRIEYEILRPWRSYFLKNLPSELITRGYNNPDLIVDYLNQNIKISDDENYYGTPITPEGVDELKVSDSKSRAICFVAICRSLGLPARLEPGTKTPQYFKDSRWHDVWFSDQQHYDENKGYIKLRSDEDDPIPEYYIHFTLARFKNGRYNTLEYDYNRKINDFSNELALPPGNYMLVTGNRLVNGNVLSELSFFNLSENEHKIIDVELRKDKTGKHPDGKADLKGILGAVDNSLKINEKGTVVIWIDPDREPTKHIFNDLARLKKEFDIWGGDFIFFSDQTNKKEKFNHSEYKGFPDNSLFGNDNGFMAYYNFVRHPSSSALQLPVVLLCDKDGNIFYHSSGYKIGIIEDILKNIN